MRKLKLTKWKQRGYTKEHCGLEKHQTYEWSLHGLPGPSQHSLIILGVLKVNNLRNSSVTQMWLHGQGSSYSSCTFLVGATDSPKLGHT
jgi:hypothetical protein